MKTRYTILTILLVFLLQPVTHARVNKVQFDFFGNKIELSVDESFLIEFPNDLTAESVRNFALQLENSQSESVTRALSYYRNTLNLEDWLYYQLIRKTAQQISPKAENYYRYTLYKWFLLVRSGYPATLRLGGQKLLFYVLCDENIYNIPYYIRDGRQFICLNYHDYGSHIDFGTEHFTETPLPASSAGKAFSYRINRLPELRNDTYEEKEIRFNYYQENYHFTIRLNPDVRTIFANYPVVDYASSFTIPISRETYQSLIPLLKKNVADMTVKGGVDYLMRFTRYAFMFKPDTEKFGEEKRLSPEETLLYNESDCEDRAALFFYLVKEIYNLPMIVLEYPKHITIAVKFDKPVGRPIIYQGERYSVCEPTPQRRDLKIGEMIPTLHKTPYEVVFAYQPVTRNIP
ncbi:MAG: hypothetical protein ACO25B_03715 [Chitinophagaceae bacterium]